MKKVKVRSTLKGSQPEINAPLENENVKYLEKNPILFSLYKWTEGQ